VPGEGLERRGDILVGWLNRLVPGRHRIDGPGATKIVVDGVAGTSSVVLDLTEKRRLFKIEVTIAPNLPFNPILTMPNGTEWEIPTWMLYSLSKASVRSDNLVLPKLSQKDAP
jgi:hypothetical protein